MKVVIWMGMVAMALVPACSDYHSSPDASTDAGSDTDADGDSDSDSDGDTDSDTGGYYESDAGFDTDTTSWSTPEVAGVLFSVWGSGSDDVYAGGEGQTLLHGSGTTWELLPLPEEFVAGDIHGSAWDSVYVAQGLNDMCDNTIIRFDGEGWGWGGVAHGCGAQAIWVFDIDDVYSVSIEYLPMEPPANPTWVSHFDGVGWTGSFIDNAAGMQPYFDDMAGTADGHLFAVIDECDYGAFVFDGSDWWWFEEVPSYALHGVWALDAENVWAVGDGGAALRRGTGVWEYEDTPTSARLDGVFGWSATEQIAVGDGVILNKSGATWELQDVPVDGALLHGVWGATPDDVYAVGALDGGAFIIHYDGATWSVVFGVGP